MPLMSCKHRSDQPTSVLTALSCRHYLTWCHAVSISPSLSPPVTSTSFPSLSIRYTAVLWRREMSRLGHHYPQHSYSTALYISKSSWVRCRYQDDGPYNINREYIATSSTIPAWPGCLPGPGRSRALSCCRDDVVCIMTIAGSCISGLSMVSSSMAVEQSVEGWGLSDVIWVCVCG